MLCYCLIILRPMLRGVVRRGVSKAGRRTPYYLSGGLIHEGDWCQESYRLGYRIEKCSSSFSLFIHKLFR